MTSMDEREKAIENSYAHQEKLDFNVEARCSKLFGLWVADQLGLEDANANTYALDVVEANLEEPGFEDVIRKVRADLDEKNIEISEHLLRSELDKALNEAKIQILNEGQS